MLFAIRVAELRSDGVEDARGELLNSDLDMDLVVDFDGDVDLNMVDPRLAKAVGRCTG